MSSLSCAAPAVPAVERAVFARRLGLAEGFGAGASPADDAMLDLWIKSAAAHIEQRIGRLLIARACLWRVAAPEGEALPLPAAPVASIESVAVADEAGLETPWPAAGWRLDALAGALAPRAGFSWPSVPTGGHLVVRFTAGYGPAPADVPDDLREAVLSLAAHWHEHREAAGEGASPPVPFGLQALLAPYIEMRL